MDGALRSRTNNAEMTYTTPAREGLGYAPDKVLEKFGLVKQIADEFKAGVSVIAINVDEESSLPNARIIKDYGLTWPHAMNGRGEADPLWKCLVEWKEIVLPFHCT